MTSGLAWWWALVAALIALLAPARAEAHPARTSAVLLDIGSRSIEAELQLPLDQLGMALERDLETSAARAVTEMEAQLRGYVAARFGAAARDGRSFSVAVRSLAVEPVDGVAGLVVRATMQPPEGATTSAFTLRDDVILHRVVTHKIFVSVRRDFKTGVFSDHPEMLGVLRYQRTSLAVDRAHGSWWRGAGSVFVLGVHHIAEGTDHLLFLLALLLPAPLVARRKRWSTPDTAARSTLKVTKIVTAFTVGHSLTLIVAGAGVLRVPSRPVEILVAVSILVSAVHAIRPLFTGREPVVAAAFGLVHGLAFATALADLGLDAPSLALGVLAFNLGIEAMQLAVVAMTMPWLVLLRRSRLYAPLRISGAAFAGVAACGWIAERALARHNPIAALADTALRRAPFIVAALALISLTVAAGSRLRPALRDPAR
ncbi:Membrane protein [Minicystis rosea]|nr:Membrane protein [Minicystis rosea]